MSMRNRRLHDLTIRHVDDNVPIPYLVATCKCGQWVHTTSMIGPSEQLYVWAIWGLFHEHVEKAGEKDGC
jgi:hypothetical protein